MSAIYVAPVGPVAREPLEWIEQAVSDWFPFPVRRLDELAAPEDAYDEIRGQYRSHAILQELARRAPADAERILGVTEGDLGVPVLTFLYGQAQLDGLVAVVSMCRLRQEFYGLLADDRLLRERAVKEALHELGHTFGLRHCGDLKCAMALSTHIQGVDAKAASYCAACGGRLTGRFTARSAGNGDQHK